MRLILNDQARPFTFGVPFLCRQVIGYESTRATFEQKTMIAAWIHQPLAHSGGNIHRRPAFDSHRMYGKRRLFAIHGTGGARLLPGLASASKQISGLVLGPLPPQSIKASCKLLRIGASHSEERQQCLCDCRIGRDSRKVESGEDGFRSSRTKWENPADAIIAIGLCGSQVGIGNWPKHKGIGGEGCWGGGWGRSECWRRCWGGCARWCPGSSRRNSWRPRRCDGVGRRDAGRPGWGRCIGINFSCRGCVRGDFDRRRCISGNLSWRGRIGRCGIFGCRCVGDCNAWRQQPSTIQGFDWRAKTRQKGKNQGNEHQTSRQNDSQNDVQHGWQNNSIDRKRWSKGSKACGRSQNKLLKRIRSSIGWADQRSSLSATAPVAS